MSMWLLILIVVLAKHSGSAVRAMHKDLGPKSWQ